MVDPAPSTNPGRRLADHLTEAWSEAAAIKRTAGQSPEGRHLAIVLTDIEKLIALVAYYGLDSLPAGVAE